MLQNKFLPNYQFSSQQKILINADNEKIYNILIQKNFNASKIVNFLFKIRGLFSKKNINSKELKENGFIDLEKIQNEEVIVGLIGQFWTINGNIKKIPAENFIRYNNPNYLKAVWNFEIIKTSDHKSILQTETRIFAPNPLVKNKFKIYWTVVKPFSSLIRKNILSSIKSEAEK